MRATASAGALRTGGHGAAAFVSEGNKGYLSPMAVELGGIRRAPTSLTPGFGRTHVPREGTSTSDYTVLRRALTFVAAMLAVACAPDEPDGASPGGSSPTGTSAPSSPGTVRGAGGASPGPTPSSAALNWYTTCGDPVCGPNASPAGVAPCSAESVEGTACSAEGERCDAMLGCGATLICVASDPKLGPGGCPISRAHFKTDIAYVTEHERRRLAEQVLNLPLATYRYRGDPDGEEHLGFIIEDVEPSLAVDAPRDRVDLYGFTSMVVAALQEQRREIETLRADLRQLRQDLTSCE